VNRRRASTRGGRIASERRRGSRIPDHRVRGWHPTALTLNDPIAESLLGSEPLNGIALDASIPVDPPTPNRPSFSCNTDRANARRLDGRAGSRWR